MLARLPKTRHLSRASLLNCNMRRTNFAGFTADKFSKKVADKLAPSVGVDVANMIADKIRKNTKTKVTEGF